MPSTEQKRSDRPQIGQVLQNAVAFNAGQWPSTDPENDDD
jgi:hypothetical protein